MADEEQKPLPEEWKDLLKGAAPAETTSAAIAQADEGETQERKHHQEKKQAWHWAFIWAIRIGAICLGVVFIVRIAHMILPTCACWLDDEQIKSMNELLFGGTIGTLFGNQLKEVAGKEKPKKGEP